MHYHHYCSCVEPVPVVIVVIVCSISPGADSGICVRGPVPLLPFVFFPLPFPSPLPLTLRSSRNQLESLGSTVSSPSGAQDSAPDPSREAPAKNEFGAL